MQREQRPLRQPASQPAIDLRIRRVGDITRPIDLLRQQPITTAAADLVARTRAGIRRILAGEDSRLLVVIGPCSVHDAATALAYARWIREVSRPLEEALLIVMRVYLEKPRTRGGWKGFINDPYLDGSCRINDGLKLARQLLLDINGIGVPAATEFVDPATPQYIGDLISWAAIGARTTESPVHRELASGLACPVGFKNNTSGDVQVAVNAAVAARRPHRFLGVTKSGKSAIVATLGNQDCHIILRGGARPNHDRASLSAAIALLEAEGVCPRVMVDCSHGNCGGDYRRQMLVAQDVARQRRDGCPHICGLMVESNVLAGSQPFVPGAPLISGLSVTDPCLGTEDTAALLNGLVDGRLASCRA